jgi:Tfp pilus assembly protein PilE
VILNMKFNRRQFGMSLMEEAVVVAIIALLLAVALPALKQLFNTMQTPAGVKAMIASALASARAMAAKDQQYVGVRFQHACYIDSQGNIQPAQSPLKMPQYMIFIKYQPPKQTGSNDQDTFNAVEGIEPIKLPENIGVMDLVLTPAPGTTKSISDDADIDDTDDQLLDTTTFSIVFSPSGKLVVRDVLTRNRDGATAGSANQSEDDIINTSIQLEKGVAKFWQDNDPFDSHELIQEPSRRSFIIYDRSVLRSLPANQRYSKYLEDLKNREMIYINPYTGTFIDR